jgi:CBS domain containing-hemolysin-like protein
MGPVLIIAILLALNGVFVAAEFAIAAAPELRLARLAETGSTIARRVLATLRTPAKLNRYISTAQVGITLASLGLGMYGEHAIAHWLEGPLEQWGGAGEVATHTLATVLSVTLLTYLHIVLGEMIPKSLALAAPDRAALRLSTLMGVLQVIFRPLTTLLNWIGDWLLRLAGVPPVDAHARLVSSAELEYIVEESTEGGLLEPTEQLYLENVLDFGERTVGQVMTPRNRMQLLPIDADRDEVLRVVCEHGYSRYPVFEGERDQIVGLLHVKDLARRLIDRNVELHLHDMLRPAVFIPETVPLEQMLKRFRDEHTQVAIVIDEFGGTAGLVTLEDIFEELIGEIQDEFDEEIPPIEELDPQTLRVRGNLLIDELNQLYGLDLQNEEADTVGGLVLVTLGRVPEPEESIMVDGIRLSVESVEGLAVHTLIVNLPTPSAGGAPSEPEASLAAVSPNVSETVAKQDKVWSPTT